MPSIGRVSHQIPGMKFQKCSPNIYPWETILGFSGKTVFDAGEIHFFRHGETYLNRKGLNSGQQDCPLTARGRMAAIKLAEDVPLDFSLVFSSPLSRSIETLELAFDRTQNKPHTVLVDARLAEKSLGVLEGSPHVFIPEYDRGDIDYAPKKGETYRQLAQRCLSFLIDLRRIVGANKLAPNPMIVVFTHMGPLRVFGSCFGKAETAKEMMARKFGNLHGFASPLSNFRIPSFFAQEGSHGERIHPQRGLSKIRA